METGMESEVGAQATELIATVKGEARTEAKARVVDRDHKWVSRTEVRGER
jgi:hypothetical protein